MEECVRPSDMKRIETKELADAFIAEQIDLIKKQAIEDFKHQKELEDKK